MIKVAPTPVGFYDKRNSKKFCYINIEINEPKSFDLLVNNSVIKRREINLHTIIF